MDLKLDDFLYDLPQDRIAKNPPKNRQDSKLLWYNQGRISHHRFLEIPGLIPKNSLLVFNDTRVIPARIIMHKKTGAKIEIFLLEPLLPSKVHEEVMNAKKSCTWKCMIGNARKWKMETSLNHDQLPFSITRVGDDQVQFNWEDDITFSDLLTEIGKIPLPPYIDRDVDETDVERYQTVYSKTKGAVAAPTAGLHFTDGIIKSLGKIGIQKDYLTLHVSAGTFQPIKEQDIANHPMHNEQIVISRNNIENLLNNENAIAVGTTSMRSLESLYWHGVKLLQGESDFYIKKEEPYKLVEITPRESLKATLEFMDQNSLDMLRGQTEIFLYPGYQFKICKGLITNYHMPASTLILLVAAFVGEDWRKIYKEALENGYRFLSYGDSSLLIP